MCVGVFVLLLSQGGVCSKVVHGQGSPALWIAFVVLTNMKSLAVMKQATALSSRPYSNLVCTAPVCSIAWLCSVPTCRMSGCLDSLWYWFATQPETESQALTWHAFADALASSTASYQCVTHHSSCTVACLCSAMVGWILLLAIQRPSCGSRLHFVGCHAGARSACMALLQQLLCQLG
jgi:hypothetical protein